MKKPGNSAKLIKWVSASFGDRTTTKKHVNTD